ncbi:hypothetical protein F8M41_007317 [Gigaspora margarita]|uniref:Uncharacterized protein n=1 Tax=Gigaspora margarita TaxID=4874 RepID=A0A8H3X5X6_GIGMA|nr:hypothetical protein F8M41_007317 [Gigaspora margarita]
MKLKTRNGGQDLMSMRKQKYNVQIKGEHINYSPKIQVFTSNAPLCEQYIYVEEKKYITNKDEEQRLNRKYYSAIEGRFDDIIEYYKFREDNLNPCEIECYCCPIRRIFHKGSYEKFNSFKFDIEFNSNVSQEKATEIIEKSSGTLLKKRNLYYWRAKRNVDKTKYILKSYKNFERKKSDIIIFPEIIEKL